MQRVLELASEFMQEHEKYYTLLSCFHNTKSTNSSQGEKEKYKEQHHNDICTLSQSIAAEGCSLEWPVLQY